MSVLYAVRQVRRAGVGKSRNRLEAIAAEKKSGEKKKKNRKKKETLVRLDRLAGRRPIALNGADEMRRPPPPRDRRELLLAFGIGVIAPVRLVCSRCTAARAVSPAVHFDSSEQDEHFLRTC